MNVLYTLNDKFVPQVGAAITSLLENNKDVDKITVYLFSMGITNNNKKELTKLCKKYNRDISIIEIDDLKKYFDFEFDTNGWNPIVLSRLLLDKLLPKELDRVLYLDGDTIVRGSLLELWNTDMDDYAIAASIEPTVDVKRKKTLGMEGLPYYNAGVLLVNLKKWRKDNVGKEIIEYYRDNKGNLFANDQDAINGSQKGKILTLSPKYNFYNIFYQYNYKFLSKLCDYDYISKDVYSDAKNNPCIIHYLGEERPWRIGNHHKYRKDYIKYLNMTLWKNDGYETGWRLYFICWDIFNIFTKPFPGLRYSIINKLIPYFMKYRSKKLIKNKEK